jgi:saccharopine dehydrogenase-like NADP-dependent oxidoreductase
VAPESDNNPWHYKISWNPRNVVLAGKAGAVYKENGKEIHKFYEDLFTNNSTVDIPDLGKLAWYPNRDSLNYIPVYGLENAQTFLRTTLRYPEFCRGWKNIIDLKLTDEEIKYDTTGMSIMSFFDIHLQTQKLDHVLDKMDATIRAYAAEMLEQMKKQKIKEDDDHLFVNEEGSLESLSKYVEVDESMPASIKFHEAQTGMEQLFYLGLINDKTPLNLGDKSPAEVLQFILEKKLVLKKRDKDMIVMMHEIEYEARGQNSGVRSTLIVKGENNLHTAMAKTVGLPLGIAAKLILEGKIKETGIHIPIIPSIYKPVLQELEKHGIIFKEEKK